ncbi:LOW QUALITY PROTEIN: hypothetical protein CsSME_00001770 [Camellia sinensis var. sinensis]
MRLNLKHSFASKGFNFKLGRKLSSPADSRVRRERERERNVVVVWQKRGFWVLVLFDSGGSHSRNRWLWSHCNCHSGIGAETARVLALRGAHVIMGVRNMGAGEEVKEAIANEVPAAKIDVMELDLSSIASVRKFALDFASLGIPLNLLINNAGIGTHFMLSKDNIELQFATNHLSFSFDKSFIGHHKENVT